MPIVIKIENLEKTYKQVQAVNRVNLSIDKGDIFGLPGPNSAGKTTLLKRNDK